MTLPGGRRVAILAATGSAVLLIAAFGFQHIGGLAPCAMCLWQRWPHAVAIVAGGLAQVSPVGAVVGLLSMLLGTGLAIFHSGVERDWWEGPTTCTSGPVDGLTPEELLAQILEAPIVRCDEIPWQLFGLSMANWNALACLGLAALWALALWRRPA